MFHRRNKLSAHSIQTRNSGQPQVSAAASSAATLAFLNNQKSNPSLSAAAAAAALRSNPQSPTDVANVHTRRLQRRESGSSASGSPRPGLERRTSLTDRTLRSPSPGKDGATQQNNYAPPMPPLPMVVERNPPGRHRAASLEAPMRISSPPPSQPGGRGVSLDRAPKSTTSPRPASVRKPKLSKLSEHNELPQRTSVNFSRPMSPIPKSPSSPTSPVTGQTGWFAGPVGSGGQPRPPVGSTRPKDLASLSPADASGIQVGLQGVADKPVKKKKKRSSGGGNQGSYLSQGTMDLTGTAIGHPHESMSPNHELGPSATDSYAASESGRSSMDSTSDASSFPDRPEQYKVRAGTLLARQPSLIDEAPEYDQQPERANTGRKVEALSQKSPLDASRVAATSSPEPGLPVQHTTASAPVESLEPNGTIVQRTASMSPPRAARFSPRPVEYLDGIKHQPPGRAVSPAKSALKYSPSSSVRTASPDVRLSSAPSSEVGEAITSMSRKKGNRVSFDETPVIVSGLQTSRFASQLPSGTRAMNDDLDDIMKPRPALPSFGSVRSRKSDEKTESPARAANTQSLAHSSDHGLGGILTQDFANKETSLQTGQASSTDRLSHDPSLPLAPEVTSVEGTGYASDSESDYSEHASQNQNPQDKNDNIPQTEPETIADAVIAIQAPETPKVEHIGTQVTHPHSLAASSHSSGVRREALKPDTSLPTIAIQPATPAAEAEEEEKELIMPGAFPGEWDDEAPLVVAPSTSAVIPQTEAVSSRTTRQIQTMRSDQSSDSESESDTSSVWSDAEEDLPSGPSGFASLNAIVDSPNVSQAPGLATSKHAPAQSASPLTEEAPPSPTAAQWDDATAYWRGLSEKRKKELEQKASRKERGLVESESEQSCDDEDIGKPPVAEVPRPATPPQKPQKVIPKLESPISFVPGSAAVASKSRKEPKLRTSMRESKYMSDDEAPPLKSSLKSSMRNSLDSEAPRMKSSLRSSMLDAAEPGKNGEHHLRSSMRNSQPRQPKPENPRRHSSGLEDSKWSQQRLTKTTDSVQNGRPRTAGGVPNSSTSRMPATPTLRRQDSDESVSSFRRQRISSSLRQDGSVNMRRSMRGPALAPAQVEQRRQPQPEKRTSGRFSLRSLSPVGRQPEVPHMKSSMRSATTDLGSPSLRELEPKKKSRFKSPTRLGFGKTKTRTLESPRAAPPIAAPSRFKSRISADSDDDDEPARAFVSRFADSDDELESPQLSKELTPVRGIPRKPGEEDYDSTDLEDSDHERPTKVPPIPSLKDIESAHEKVTLPNGNRTASVLSTGSLRKVDTGLGASKHAPSERTQHKRRLSWLGIGNKRRGSSVPPVDMSSPLPSRGNDASVKPNLLRRSTPTGLPQISEDNSTNWPLAGEDLERPSTADGPGTKLKQGTMRPDVGKRRSTADYVGSERNAVDESVDGAPRKRVGFNFESGEPVYSMRTGRKKKFGTLRKMFGLND